ncbi:putative bifunctional diguanylate cyclase/phosphodiesterase [Lichenibacterium dinghuense]|uniref:putative bifunctional diguanylate cyclase/phosphodiesterase n=1 Tax=Lichenibacterium dinghuense TaxID=2895977 RepID=UPI001F341BAC|nr:EAL domain-containing protein [Lichenibacterium sp. 6Y81]
MDGRIATLSLAVSKRRMSVICGLCVVAVLWGGVAYKGLQDLDEARRASDRSNAAVALMFEENVVHVIAEIDKSLLFMRSVVEARGTAGFSGLMEAARGLLNDVLIQVAVLDAGGVMRATTWGPQPPPPTDLSDRKHFTAQRDAAGDGLYISVPVLGRATGKTTVQFSRRTLGPGGAFGGVVVASLDPARLADFFNRIDLGSKASLALIGDDGIVRATGGADAPVPMGADVRGTALGALLAGGREGTFALPAESGLPDRVVTLERVRGQPLAVAVSVPEADIDRDAKASLFDDTLLACLLTVLVAVAVAKLLRIEAERAEAERGVLRLALRDPLTDLPNRRDFRAKLDAADAAARCRAGSAPYAVLLLDVDGFKFVNDTLGHGVGDSLLVAIGERLRSVMQEGAVVARLGGDEFAVLIPDAPRYAVDVIAARICAVMAKPFAVDRHTVRSGACVGIAFGPEDGGDADEVLAAADLALYAAKGGQRGRFLRFRGAMRDELTERRALEADLAAALDAGGLDLHFQPTVDLATGAIAGFEALARWDRPGHGAVSPALFVTVAEECGLIGLIGEWALREACGQARRWPAPLRVAVNLSPVQFLGPDVVALVAGVLRDTGLPADRLELELTERVLLDDVASTLKTLHGLKALGVSIAMDDFGTGHSSLGYLRQFPFDRIKVDRSFVSEVGLDEQHAAIVRAVVDIARSAGMATTAEGVETEEQRERVASLGCTTAQGYLFSRAVPAAEVPALIAAWPAARPIAA